MVTPAEGMERLPCGCLMGNVGEAFVIEPCSLTCRYYLYVLEESERQGHPVTKLDLR